MKLLESMRNTLPPPSGKTFRTKGPTLDGGVTWFGMVFGIGWFGTVFGIGWFGTFCGMNGKGGPGRV